MLSYQESKSFTKQWTCTKYYTGSSFSYVGAFNVYLYIDIGDGFVLGWEGRERIPFIQGVCL